MRKQNVYIIVEDDGKRIVVDGSLPLLRQLLDALRPERREAERATEGERERPEAVATC